MWKWHRLVGCRVLSTQGVSYTVHDGESNAAVPFLVSEKKPRGNLGLESFIAVALIDGIPVFGAGNARWLSGFM